MYRQKSVAAVIIFLLLSFYCNAQKILMKAGASTDPAGEEVRAFEFGITSPSNFTSGSGASIGKAVPGNIKIKKNAGKSTSDFFKNIVKRTAIPQVIFEYYDASNILYYTITISNVLITNLLWLSPECPSCLKLEHEIDFVFKTIKTDDLISGVTLTYDVSSQIIQ